MPLSMPETREQIVERYEREFPILHEYNAVVREHSDPQRSIHEPSGGVDTMFATREALTRIGRPARDQDDVQHAFAFVRQLQDEIATQTPVRLRTLQDLVIDTMFPWAGCVPDATAWLLNAKNEQLDQIEEIVNTATEDELRRFLVEALLIAMPHLLAVISYQDEQRRGKVRLLAVDS